MDALNFVPWFMMAALLALIVIAPLLSDKPPDFPDRRRDEE